MMPIRTSFLSLLIFSFVFFAGLTALAHAHDDGLTCHEHPCTENYPGGACWDGYFRDVDPIPFDAEPQNGRGSLVALGAVLHRFDNLVELAPGTYDPQSVRQLRAAVNELRQNIFLVLALLNRSETAKKSTESAGLVKAARTLFKTAGMQALAEFKAVQAAVKKGDEFVIGVKQTTTYLSRRYGVSEKILAALNDAVASC